MDSGTCINPLLYGSGFLIRNERLWICAIIQDMEFTPLHFFDHPIEVIFDTPPAREKAPDCPNGFIWNGKTYRVMDMLSAWTDFKRRGRMARNLQPAHAAAASARGSLNVGRYYFRVKVDTGQIFDVYYDRAMKNVDDRKGQWFVYRELRSDA